MLVDDYFVFYNFMIYNVYIGIAWGIGKEIREYLNNKIESYIEIGNKSKNYTPAFSMKLENPSEH